MMALKGLELLPPVVEMSEALTLYKKVSNIKSKIGRLNSELHHSLVNEKLIQLLSFSESVQSTRIEGTQVTFANIIDEVDKKNKSAEVTEVENYKKALDLGISLVQEHNPISTKLIQQVHSKLMNGETRGTTSASGEYRKIQNFIGPDNKIEHAVYIPVPANDISMYMSNLEYYINGEHHHTFPNNDLPSNLVYLDEKSDPLIRTAILHAQFESIHPFLDGNGRVGRILIVLSTMVDELLDQPVFFVSEELEKERLRYYNMLNGIRGEKPKWFEWINFFLDACNSMADSLLNKLIDIQNLNSNGLDSLQDSSNNVKKTWMLSFSVPFLSVKSVSNMLDVSAQSARKYLNELVSRGLIDTDNSKKRNRTYVNYDLLKAIDNR